ncbi:MAG: ABC transporter permease [Clostridia bacterium]|nr:ABC transporter permease [Clostridia bacterium]
MALLGMVFRKMVKNIWLVCCLLLGLIICVSLVSSIPIYIEGSLQKLLVKDLENFQKENKTYPGLYRVFVSMDEAPISQRVRELKRQSQSVIKDETIKEFYKNQLTSIKKLDGYASNGLKDSTGLPLLSKLISYSTDIRRMESENPDKASFTGKVRYAKIESMSELEKHITLVDGKAPASTPVNGVYETLVSEDALRNLGMVLGEVFTLTDTRYNELEPVRVKPVGVFAVKNPEDMYWTLAGPDTFNRSFFINEDLMRKDFIEKEFTLFKEARWYYAFDYQAMSINNIGGFVGGYKSFVKEVRSIAGNNDLTIEAPSMEIISSYTKKESQLKTMLLALNVPVIIMLLLYLFMVSKLIIEREKNEIALLASRGANRFQIVLGYCIEGLVLGLIAFAIGPWIGMLISKMLGASSGFLQFAKRKALPLSVNEYSYMYAALTVGLSMLTILIPAYVASKTSIVSHKRSMSRKNGAAIWKKFFFDVVLIAISLYGYYSFTQRQNIIKATGASALEVQVDPLLFFVPALFILGVGLFALRLYPWLVKGIYALGKKIWSPSVYATLIQVGRSLEGYHFLMIFLVMTLSIGLFSSTAARTINRNAEEKISYKIGSDMVIKPMWETDAEAPNPYQSDANKQKAKVRIYEPPFTPYTQLSGVEHAAKVFVKDDVNISSNGQNAGISKLMGIEPYDFGKVAWFRSGLLPHHINQYLNLMSDEPSACLISSSISKAYKIKTGDSITIQWGETAKVTFTVYGIIDYWPSWNPNIDPMRKEQGEPNLVVANLQYVQDHLALEPYDVWLKMKPEATSKQLYDSLKEKKIDFSSLTDSRQELIKLKNNPFQLAINGALTLGFVISGLVCFLGFLLYWVLSINSRTLQFGIFRAIGLSVRRLNSMMIWEQALTSGAAMIMGLVIGLVASRLFVPFFQVAFDAASQVPPFRVISYASDRMNIYILTGITLILGLLTLWFLLSRIKINQAIKLGEE